MNISSEQSQPKKEKKGSKILKLTIIVTVLILLITIGLIMYGASLNKDAFKVILNGKQVSNISEDTFIIDENDVKIKIKDIATLLGNYSFRNGEYGRSSQYTEDKNSCYLISANEVVSFSQNSKTIEKVILNEGTLSNSTTPSNNELKYEEYDIKKPVEIINSNLYANLDGISIGCNIQISYDKESNSIKIFTLDYLTEYYTELIQKADISGENVIFSNKKAVLYGLVVVKDENGNYGVNSLNNEVIIGEKYKSVKFIESTKEFIVQTNENKMGIISISSDNQSKTKITPAYDSIEEIDDKLYLVSSNNKYGIINKNNQMIVNTEFSEIGISMSKLSKYDVKNGYIIYDECIPVKKDNLWGFISKTTRTYIIEPIYDDIGCVIGTSSENSAKNVILVPEYEGIIVQKEGKYGLINSLGKVIIQPGPTEFYMTSSEDQVNYYFVYNGEKVNLIEFLKQNNILPINEITDDKNNETSSLNTELNNVEE